MDAIFLKNGAVEQAGFFNQKKGESTTGYSFVSTVEHKE
jgi:hypothetical protein